MNKPKKKQHPKQKQKITKPPQKVIKKPKAASFFENAEKWFGKNSRLLFIIISIFYVLFAFMIFDIRISEANDDSLYIEAGYNFAKDFFNYYYVGNAPLYPMFLGVLIAMIGVKLVVFKIFSVIFNFLGIFFLYKAFKDKIPYFILIPVLFIVAINSYFLVKASQTFTEAFYLCFQGAFFYSFRILIDKQEQFSKLKDTYKAWLVFGFFSFILTITRNVAVASIAGILLYFVVVKEYKNILYYIGSFAIFKVLFEIIKSLVWGSVGQYRAQGLSIFQKDYYNADKGMEDFWGIVTRFFNNADLYISKRLFQILGFKSPESYTTSTTLTVIVVILILWGLYRCYKSKNKILLLSTLYFLALLGASFIALHTRWDQPRMIMIHLPFILFIILYGIYDLLKRTSTPVQTLFLYLLIAISLSVLISSIKKSQENLPRLSKNIKGDIYYGYTPDWVNYFKMSKWIGENMPDTALVACRKAPMSFIHSGGKPFFPIYKVYFDNPDSTLAFLKKNKVTHVMLANLRRNPKKADGYIINTIHRTLKPIADKYPQKLRVIHKIGEYEPAYLYEINYDAPNVTTPNQPEN